jgi:uncharacterized membrane protein
MEQSITIATDTIIAAGAVVTALAAMFGIIFSAYRWYLRQAEEDKKHDKEIAAMKAEETIVIYALSACLDGLMQLGANHTVPVAKDKLDKYINQKAHE